MRVVISPEVRRVANPYHLMQLVWELSQDTYAETCCMRLTWGHVEARCLGARGSALIPANDLGLANRQWLREAVAERYWAAQANN